MWRIEGVIVTDFPYLSTDYWIVQTTCVPTIHLTDPTSFSNHPGSHTWGYQFNLAGPFTTVPQSVAEGWYNFPSTLPVELDHVEQSLKTILLLWKNESKQREQSSNKQNYN